MTTQTEATRLAENELLIIRTFDAPVSLVFRVWERREHMIRWLGPKDFTCTSLDLDFRPGGKWRACIESEAQGQLWMGGQFREIEKERRIVYTFAWEDGPNPPTVETLVTVTFAEQDGKTVQRFHQAPFLDVESRDGHIDGWNQSFDKQQTYAESLAQEAQR